MVSARLRQRRGLNDGTAAVAHHVRDRRPARPQIAFEIGGERCAEDLNVGVDRVEIVCEQAQVGTVIQQSVDATMTLHNVVHQLCQAVAIPQVGPLEFSLATCLAQFLGKRRTALLTDAAEDDRRALLRQSAGRACPDALARADDDDDLRLE